MKKLGKFELRETLGAGAMSTVYRGMDTKTGEEVAIKVLHAHLATGVNLARFEREAQVLSSLTHPNIVSIRAFSHGEDGDHYSVLEFVAGQNLAEFLSRERDVQVDLAAMMLLELTKATAIAHAKGVVHRDLKPENILISNQGHLKISDFGLAYLWEGTDLTMPGTLIGSPAFMSPEQIRGEKPAAGMDIFSLGILFYLCLAGELPFQGRNRRETFDLILHAEPASFERLKLTVPEKLARLCQGMMAKKALQRIDSADHVIRELEEYLAAIGLSTYEPILQKYLENPRNNRDEVRRELLNGYLRVGKRAVETNDRDRVMELFQRVLVLTGIVTTPQSTSEESQPTQKVRIMRDSARVKVIMWVVCLALLAWCAFRLVEFF